MSFVYSKKRILGGKRKIRSRTGKNRRNGGSGKEGMSTGLKDHRGNMIYVPIKPDGEYAIEGDVGDSSLPDVAQLRVDGAKTPTMDEIDQVSSENSTLNFIAIAKAKAKAEAKAKARAEAEAKAKARAKGGRRKTKRSSRKSRKSKRRTKK